MEEEKNWRIWEHKRKSIDRIYNLKLFFVYGIILLLFILLILSNTFSHVRAITQDSMQGQGEVSEEIIIIAIDDESLNAFGRWPWERELLKEIIDQTEKAKSVGIDISLFEKTSEDQSLQEILKKRTDVILASEIMNEGILKKPIFDVKSGYVNVISDNDGLVRSLNIQAHETEKPFSLAVYEISGFTEKEFSKARQWINFKSTPNGIKTLSAKDLLKKGFDKEILSGKIVLIGVTAPDIHDTSMVPTSKGEEMSGVEIQAHILNNIIQNSFIQKESKAITIFLVFFIALITLIYSKTKFYYTFPILGVLILGTFILGIFLFQEFNYSMDLFYYPLSLITFTTTGYVVHYSKAKKKIETIKEAFRKYVNKDILKEIIKKGDKLNLEGEKKDLTILFSDIRNFTTLSEKLNPKKLEKFINIYLTQMTKIIMSENGTVNKFIGDGIMAFWNAPLKRARHEKLACKSAIAQIKALRKINKMLGKQDLPSINVGCGIDTGEVIVGNFGSEKRLDYTAFGNAVNTASRLESLTKLYEVNIIISKRVYEKIKSRYAVRKIDEVKLRGKEDKEEIFELCVKINPYFLETYNEALSFFEQEMFEEAKEMFLVASNVKKNDIPTKMFIDACENQLKVNLKKILPQTI